jgi:hypothetical protein
MYIAFLGMLGVIIGFFDYVRGNLVGGAYFCRAAGGLSPHFAPNKAPTWYQKVRQILCMTVCQV